MPGILNILGLMLLGGGKRNQETDEQLVTRYRYSHDPVFVGELFERYTHFVFGICMKYLKNEENSKDAVMEIFEKVLQALKKHDVRNFRSWVFSMSKNHCLEKTRKKVQKRQKEEDYMNIADDFMENTDPGTLTEKEERERFYEKLEEEIQNLNAEQKECIELFYLHHKSYKEIVDITGYDLKEVKSFLQNGKRNLRARLNKDH